MDLEVKLQIKDKEPNLKKEMWEENLTSKITRKLCKYLLIKIFVKLSIWYLFEISFNLILHNCKNFILLNLTKFFQGKF